MLCLGTSSLQLKYASNEGDTLLKMLGYGNFSLQLVYVTNECHHLVNVKKWNYLIRNGIQKYSLDPLIQM